MGLYRKHRSATERRTEVSPIGYQALTPATSEPVELFLAEVNLYSCSHTVSSHGQQAT